MLGKNLKKQLRAIINLGWHFAFHLLELVRRFLGKKAPGLHRFRENYGAEGLSPLSAANRENLFQISGCVGCGLCRMTLNLHPEGGPLSDPESLALSLSRALPVVGAARASFTLARAALAGPSLCPRGVSLPQVFDFLATADQERK